MLVQFELGMLDAADREATGRHVRGCSACSERLTEIRAGIASAAADVQDVVEESAHVPPDLLAEFCAAPSGIGADVAAAVAAHVERCPQCADEVARARAATEATWAQAADRRERAVEARPRAPREAGSPLRRWLGLGPIWRPALFAAAGAAVVALGMPFWLGNRDTPLVAAGTPVRLLGTRAAADSPPAVTVDAEGSLVLFLKLAERPDPAARYDVVLEGAAGSRLTRTVRGSDFDPSATLGVLLATRALADGEEVRVRVERAGEIVFADALTIRRATSE
jgi:hypothetical protein